MSWFFILRSFLFFSSFLDATFSFPFFFFNLSI
jgi:hypothetical protein